MAIYFSELPNVLLKPTDTLNKLKKDANLDDGLKLYLVYAIVSFVIAVIFDKVMMMKLEGLLSQYPFAASSSAITSDVMIVAGEIFNVIMGLAGFLIMCWLIAKITASIGQGKADFAKTLGLSSYVIVAFGLFIMVPLAIIFDVIIIGSFDSLTSLGNIGGFLINIFAMLAVLLVFLVWELLIAGKAAAAANKTSWAAGIAGVFLSVLLVLGVILVLGILFVLGTSAVM